MKQKKLNSPLFNTVTILLICFSLVLSSLHYTTFANDKDEDLTTGQIQYFSSIQEEFAFGDLANTSYGGLEIKLPTSMDSTDYQLNISILRYYDSDNSPLYYGYNYNETYYLTFSNNSELDGWYEFKYIYNNFSDRPELSATISNVPVGNTVNLADIQISSQEDDGFGGDMWYNYSNTQVEITVTDPSNATVVLKVDGDNPVKLVENTVKTMSVIASGDVSQAVTTDKLNTYSIIYMLNNYNVVSLDDIESTHIVGPIITQNMARRTTNSVSEAGIWDLNYNPGGALAAADYSRGMPSYAGNLVGYGSTTAPNGAGIKNSSLQLNYAFDLTEDSSGKFSAPNFYTRENHIGSSEPISIFQIYSGISPLDFVSTNDCIFLSPNNYGSPGIILQNDDYIDFTSLKNQLISDCNAIYNNGNAEGVASSVIYEFNAATKTVTDSSGALDNTKYGAYTTTNGSVGLNIGAGQSWRITDATNLEAVNIILPDDYDYFGNPYIAPTTINFTGSEINPTTINGNTHSQLPYTLINGSEFTATTGIDGEYSEVGNKIIWNLPNVVTTGESNRLVTVGHGQNIAGHLIAPQAEFWNYDENQNWEGGNINGAVITQSFYSGVMEMHMWPYSGYALPNEEDTTPEIVYLGVKASKTVDSFAPDESYDFVLNIDRTQHLDAGIPEGIGNTHFPISATSHATSGAISFSTLIFNKSGTYHFTVCEVIPTYSATDNIDYDESVYRLEVEVDDKFNVTATFDDVIIGLN